jgi:hypothetical protein
MRWGARASFVVEGVEAMRAFLEDRDSMATRELKARARAKGISSGRLWKAAERLDEILDRDAAQPNGGPGTLYGYR